MSFLRATAILFSSLLSVKCASNGASVVGRMLIDFTDSSEDVSKWEEVSDTVRRPGMSKGAFVRVESQLFTRAVFFSLLNPQPNGAGFVSMRRPVKWDLSSDRALAVRARAQGENKHYKISLRHKGLDREPNPSYEIFFTAPSGDFDVVELPLSDFAPYYRGRKLPPSEAEPLDTSKITSFEFQIYGGVYSEVKQKGASALEIDWVKAV